MKTFCIYGGILLMILCLPFSYLHAQTADYVPGQVLIKMKDNKSATQKNALKNQMDGETIKTFPELGIELWKVKSAATKTATKSLIDKYQNHPDIEFIEPDYYIGFTGTIPDDPLFGVQWALNNTGQNGGTPDADIDAPEAWDIISGSPSVAAAIIDNGISWTHEDLVDNIWQNMGEDADGDGQVIEWNGTAWVFDSGDENGIDDDGNGYVDDFIGWDFADNDNNPLGGIHGTYVSSVAGATGDNGIGMSGVSQDIQLAGLKIAKNVSLSLPSVSAGVEAINYAVAMGMPVSNNSWGWQGSGNNTLYAAIQNADVNGHLFVTAAGNNGSDNDVASFYPGAYNLDNIIVVANSDRNDELYYSSNFGATSVDIVAPGTGLTLCKNNNGYITLSGGSTSYASPHLVGACALLWELYPNKTHYEIKEAILNSVDQAPALAGKCVSDGRLNLYNALTYYMPCRYKDSLALVALYNSTNGIPWDLSQPLDTWYGVILNGNDCVKQLRLQSKQITGTIPQELGNLSSLTVLWLYNNQLTGTIPPQLGNLSNLVNLRLYGNQLSGSIPAELGNLTKLTNLRIYNNQLSGSIPPELGNLTKLRYLYAYNNQLSGSIPSELGSLSLLRYLKLQNNQLSGNIPASLSNLDAAINIFLHNNDLTGTIPKELGGLNSIKGILLKNNQLTGCYEQDLVPLCSKLSAVYGSNTWISNGNNFYEPWEDFCDRGTTNCGDLDFMPTDLSNDDRQDNTITNGLSIQPNPFSSTTSIGVTLMEDSQVSLEILNLNGQVVAQLIDAENRLKGEHQVSLNAENLSSGIYYCVLKTGKTIQTQKMVIYK